MAVILSTQDIEGSQSGVFAGQAYEHDVPGLYAQVILQPCAMSREKRYGEGGSYPSNVTLRTSQTK